VEAHLTKTGTSRGRFETFAQFGWVEDGAEAWVCEDEVVVGGEAGLLEVVFELGCECVGERDASA
jgi:hypothetical protein